MRKTSRGDAGFSLIELLVVISVFGVLVAIAVPSIASMRSRSTDYDTRVALTPIVGAIRELRNETSGPITLTTTANKVVVSANIGGQVISRDAGVLPTNTSFAKVVGVVGTGLQTPPNGTSTPYDWCISLTNVKGSIKTFKYGSDLQSSTGDCW